MKIEKDSFKKRVIELGYNLSGKDLNRAFKAYKELQGKEVNQVIDILFEQLEVTW